MENLNDAQLIRLFNEGSNEAFEVIVMRYQAHIYSYVMSITNDYEISNDVIQETFIRAFKKLKNYKDENKLKNWLFTLARNITMDYYRKNSVKAAPLETKDEDELSLIDSLSDNSPQPIDAAIAKDRDNLINEALSKLSAEERELISLKDSMTFQEISQMQNKPIGTLLSKFNRALGKLKKILAESSQEAYNELLQ